MNLVVAAPGVYMNLFDEEDQFSAESFRYSYFPDFYAPLLRDPTVNASEFDPVSCVLYTNNKQYEHVMERGAEDLLHEIKAECEGLTPAEQETFVLNNTSFSHELRHFHDLIGTAAGLQRFVLIAGDVARFVASLFELKRGGLSRVPMQWCKDERLQKDRPYVLEYVTEHRHTVETVAILDGAVFVPNEEPIRQRRKQTIIGFLFPEYGFGNIASEWDAYQARMKEEGVPSELFRHAQPGQLIFVPGVPLNNVGTIVENIAVGTRVLTEGNAFLVQRKWIGHVFGEEREMHAKRQLERSSPLFELPYMVSDLMIAKFVGKFYESLVTTLSDHALNFSDSDNFLESHPGWRLLTVLQSGTWRGDTVADYGTALLRWDRVVLDNQIAALRKIAEGWDLLAGGFGGSIARVIRDVAGRASMVADARERNHGIFAYPSVYIEKSIEELPFPPTLVIPSGEVALPVSVGYGEATAEDWANWMFLVNLVACVIHEAELSCPVKRRGMFCATANEVCDKLPTSMAREAGVGCAFYRFLIAIGVAREPRERQREPG